MEKKGRVKESDPAYDTLDSKLVKTRRQLNGLIRSQWERSSWDLISSSFHRPNTSHADRAEPIDA